MYNRKHHDHPIIPKGYDYESSEYTIMDENYETSKRGGAVEYNFRNIDKQELQKLCCDISKTNFIRRGMAKLGSYGETSFCYFKFEKDPEKPAFIGTDHIVKKYKELLPQVIKYLDEAAKNSRDLLKTLEDDSSLIRNIYRSYIMARKAGFQHSSNKEMVFNNYGGIISSRYYTIIILEILFNMGKVRCKENDLILFHLHSLVAHYNDFRNLFFKLIFSDDESKKIKYFSGMYTFLDAIHVEEIGFYNQLSLFDWKLNDI